jgi:tetratricopeptide (TPR) repeat protein
LYNKSITVLEKNKDEYNLAVNYNNLGDCYIHLKQYDKAINYFEKALVISNKWILSHYMHYVPEYCGGKDKTAVV